MYMNVILKIRNLRVMMRLELCQKHEILKKYT